MIRTDVYITNGVSILRLTDWAYPCRDSIPSGRDLGRLTPSTVFNVEQLRRRSPAVVSPPDQDLFAGRLTLVVTSDGAG